jgi:hypothetical protein
MLSKKQALTVRFLRVSGFTWDEVKEWASEVGVMSESIRDDALKTLDIYPSNDDVERKHYI